MSERSIIGILPNSLAGDFILMVLAGIRAVVHERGYQLLVIPSPPTSVAANSLDLAKNGQPKPPFYVTGQVDGASFSLHAEGSRLMLTRPGQPRQEVELAAPPAEASSLNEPSADTKGGDA